MSKKKCRACPSLSGKKRISPGPEIYRGQYWSVDHAYPVGLLGWLVIEPIRHVTALHNITVAEWAEFAKIHTRVIKAVNKVLNTDKEYSACFAEAPGFNHIHFHIIPRSKALPKKFRGSKVFGMMKEKPVAPEKVIEVCKKLTKAMSR